MNEESVIISDLGESFGEIFTANAHDGALLSCYFHILFIPHTLQNLQKFPYIMLNTRFPFL